MSFDEIRTYEVERENFNIDHEKKNLKFFENTNINVKI